MKKLLVTGISSFLGKELAFFPQQEWKITGLYNHNEFEFPNVECLKCDITNDENLSQIVKNDLQGCNGCHHIWLFILDGLHKREKAYDACKAN